ncbi:unnamed protein product [Amoebophrya sp. A25]|nr:unnamed protein product [Amoebophrya sp. A25]|eukprot:GSA25T00017038001.1
MSFLTSKHNPGLRQTLKHLLIQVGLPRSIYLSLCK